MQVKIFTGFGKQGIDKMEKEINAWIRQPMHRYEIVNTQVAMCTVADNGTAERFQCMGVTIWYRDMI
jgi:hypothetical protein